MNSEKKLKFFSIKSTSLILFLALYHIIFLNWQFWISLTYDIKLDSHSFLFYISLLVVAFTAYTIFFSLIVIPYLTKILVSFFLIASSATNYVMYTYGVYIDKSMMRNVFETTPREAFDLFTWSAIINVFILGVIPSLYICCSKIIYKKFFLEVKARIGRILIFFITALIFAFISREDFVVYGRIFRPLRKQVNVLNYINGTMRFISENRESSMPFQELEHDIQIVKKGDSNVPTVLVMLVGEAARVANFSLAGYEKETNPLLKKQDIAFFGKVTSCGTATATSVPCIFSHVDRKDFDVSTARHTENLLDLLKFAGLHIVWRENDDGCKGVCDRLDDVETMPDTKDKDFCFDSFCHDEVFLKPLDDFFKRGIEKDTVIVLHTMGSHGPSYHLRYPNEFKRFTPTCDSAEINKCPVSDVVNTYDNTILYTDYTISSVIDIVKKYPQYGSAVLYVSDHGESLGENNIYLHGVPYSFAPKVQIEIPMVVWFNDLAQRISGIDYDCLKRIARAEAFSHDNIFSTVLGFFNAKTKFYNKEMDIFAHCRKS